MSMNRRTSRGFTVVELLISMALIALMMLAATMAMQAAHDSHQYNSEKNDLVARTRGSLDRIARDVRLAAAFQVVDPQTVSVTMPNGIVHTYAWDGVAGGSLTYTQVDDLISTSVVLTNRVQSFVASDDTPACSVKLRLAGDLTTAEASVTATPRKSVF